MNVLFRCDEIFQQLMYETDSVPHLWLSLRDFFLSITLYCVIIPACKLSKHLNACNKCQLVVMYL